MPNEEITQDAQKGRQEVQRLISTVVRNVDNISDANRQRAQDLLSRGGQFLDRVDNIQVANLSAYDMIGGAYKVATVAASGGSAQEVGEAVLENTVGTIIDNFLEEHATYEGELFSFDQQVSTPVFTGVNADLGFNAEVKTKLNVRRSGASITGTAALKSLARLRIGISFGFNAPGLGNQSIQGGLQGGPNIDAQASIRLAISGANLTGELRATPLNVSLNTELYFGLPEAIPHDVIEWVAEKLELPSSSNRILFPMGTLNVITATTPVYTITFDMRRREFTNASATGSWSFELNQRIKDFVQRLKNALSEAFEAVRRAAAAAVGAVADGAQAVGQAVVDGAQAVVEGAQAVGNAVSNAANVVVNTANSVANTTTNTVRRVVRSTRQAAQQVTQTVSNATNRVVDLGHQAVQTVQNTASQIAAQASQAVESLSETGRQALSTAREAASEALNTGRNLAREVGNTVSEGASEAYRTISSGARSVLSSLNPFD